MSLTSFLPIALYFVTWPLFECPNDLCFKREFVVVCSGH